VRTLVAAAQDRAEHQVDTALEVDELRRRGLRLRQTLAAARRELAMLEVREPAPPPEDLNTALERYERATLDRETELSDLLRMSDWDLRLQLGGIPGDRPDWFGTVQVSYNLGDLFVGSSEDSYLASKRAELASSSHELRAGLDRFRRAMAASAAAIDEEIALVDRDLSLARETRSRIEELGGPDAMRRAALAEIDTIELEARRIYLERLASAQHAAGGDK
jgi:hypothetical protein